MTFRSGGLGITEESALFRMFDRDADRRAELASVATIPALAELQRALEDERREVARLREDNARLRAELELATMDVAHGEIQ